MEKRYISRSKEETWEIAKELLPRLVDSNVIALQGELGAGKTTFSQGVLRAAGAEGPFTSPTFVIMKKYDLKAGAVHGFTQVYHLDCYRVGGRDVLDLGWQEIISNPKNLVLVEWPERIKDILPEHFLRILFLLKNEKERELVITKK